jgi:hypothetical protein
VRLLAIAERIARPSASAERGGRADQCGGESGLFGGHAGVGRVLDADEYRAEP